MVTNSQKGLPFSVRFKIMNKYWWFNSVTWCHRGAVFRVVASKRKGHRFASQLICAEFLFFPCTQVFSHRPKTWMLGSLMTLHYPSVWMRVWIVVLSLYGSVMDWQPVQGVPRAWQSVTAGDEHMLPCDPERRKWAKQIDEWIIVCDYSAFTLTFSCYFFCTFLKI